MVMEEVGSCNLLVFQKETFTVTRHTVPGIILHLLDICSECD